uniref:DUF1897 domain-containing protein n=1 Tax=Caenorhabditis tropicalis TaxID=1561998 RepID=A0A1I7U986_9PELO
MQAQFSSSAQAFSGAQTQWNPAVSQVPAVTQNPYQVGGGGWQQNNLFAQQQAAPYATSGMVQSQPQQAAYQQQQVVQQPQSVATGVAPAVDPVTGEQDYSAQWMEYYKSIGAHDKAEAVEAQMKKKKAEAAARVAGPAGLIQQIPVGMAMQQMTSQARVPTQTYPAYSAAGTVAYQQPQYQQYQ